MTTFMVMGLIDPPASLSIFVIKNLAPHIVFKDMTWGVAPVRLLMFLAVYMICLVPGISAGLQDMMMRKGR